jgi:two-component system, LytTR family, response regulator
MIRAVIIDDESKAITALNQLLSNFVTVPVKIVGTAMNLEDGVKTINSTNPDVVFLDIDLPDKNGLEIYNSFENPEFKVIYVTAYNQYAISALKKSAIDYLLKPVNIIELREALTKLSDNLKYEQYTRSLEDKVNLLTRPEMEGQNIVFEVPNGFFVENTRNIEYCYADRAYSVIVTQLGKETIVSKPLKDLQDLLPENHFFRTHKSYLVNIFHIRKFVKADDSYILLKSGTRIPVSVRTSSLIAKKIKQLLQT